MHHSLMTPAHGPITTMLNWMIEHWGYATVLLIKDTLPAISAIIMGIIIGVLFMIYVGRDFRMVLDDAADEIAISGIRKSKRKKILISVPKYTAKRLGFATAVTIYIIAAFIRICPVCPKFQFVDNAKIHGIFVSVILIILVICIFVIVVDFHSIIPDGHGHYTILEYKH